MTNAERWAARVLQVGGLAAVTLMVVGIFSSAVLNERGGATAMPTRARAGIASPQATETIASITQIRVALSQRPIDPLAIAALGFVALCLTPFAAVVSAGIAFYLEGDRQFTAISAVIAAALLLGFWLGGA